MTFSIGTPHTKNSGYFKNDDTPSGGSLEEADLKTCNHCQRTIKMQVWKENGAWCARCESPVCADGICAAETERLGCIPFKKKIDMELARAHNRARLAGL